jgi:hypothetical protein
VVRVIQSEGDRKEQGCLMGSIAFAVCWMVCGTRLAAKHMNASNAAMLLVVLIPARLLCSGLEQVG